MEVPKICSKCKVAKPLEEFGKHGWCRECIRAYERNWRKNTEKGREHAKRKGRKHYALHGERVRARRRQNWKNTWAKIRAIYGETCACCGESELSFLTVEHVNQDGAADRRKHGGNTQLRNWLAKQPKLEGYEILCWNCQWGRKLNGGICPHRLKD